jgi:maltose/moltooligosaccharide transporter
MPYAILSTALPGNRMGVYMGIFNFFIVIPEIIASLTFGPVTRALFGQDNPDAPLYTVMLGGLCMIVAAVCVLFVHDNERAADERLVAVADSHQSLSMPENVQPVPSSGA